MRLIHAINNCIIMIKGCSFAVRIIFLSSFLLPSNLLLYIFIYISTHATGLLCLGDIHVVLVM